MALVFTVAGMQTYLDAYNTAFRAGDFATAKLELQSAEMIRMSLPDSVSDAAGGAVGMPALEWFEQARLSLQRDVDLASRKSRKRIIQMGTSHEGRPDPRGTLGITQ